MFDLNAVTQSISIAAVAPCPIVVWPDSYAEQISRELDVICTCFGVEIVRASRRMLIHRCAPLRHLPAILRTGRDAEPIDAVFYASDRIEKVLEYGGREQALMVYDPREVRTAWIQVTSNVTGDERAEIERLYPTVVWEDGTTTKRSRLSAHLYATGSDYDHYAYWIPGNPFKALIALVIIGRPGYPLAASVEQMIKDCPAPVWQPGTAEERADVLARFTDSGRLTLRT